MADEVTVEVSPQEPSPTDEAAAAAVATAGAAVALAHETAAHAELQAAEEIAETREEIDTWQMATAALGGDLATLNERIDSLASLEAERHRRIDALEASQQSILSRLEENQAQLLASQAEEPLSESVPAEPAAESPPEPERVERRRAHRWI